MPKKKKNRKKSKKVQDEHVSQDGQVSQGGTVKEEEKIPQDEKKEHVGTDEYTDKVHAELTEAVEGYDIGCAHCQALTRPSGEKLLVCAQCKVFRYCCTEHQRHHWKRSHKRLCKVLVKHKDSLMLRMLSASLSHASAQNMGNWELALEKARKLLKRIEAEAESCKAQVEQPNAKDPVFAQSREVSYHLVQALLDVSTSLFVKAQMLDEDLPRAEFKEGVDCAKRALELAQIWKSDHGATKAHTCLARMYAIHRKWRLAGQHFDKVDVHELETRGLLKDKDHRPKFWHLRLETAKGRKEPFSRQADLAARLVAAVRESKFVDQLPEELAKSTSIAMSCQDPVKALECGAEALSLAPYKYALDAKKWASFSAEQKSMYKWLIGAVCWAHVTLYGRSLSVRRPTREQARDAEENRVGLMTRFSQVKRFQSLYPSDNDREFQHKVRDLERLIDKGFGKGFSKTMGSFSESLFSLDVDDDGFGEGLIRAMMMDAGRGV